MFVLNKNERVAPEQDRSFQWYINHLIATSTQFHRVNIDKKYEQLFESFQLLSDLNQS